ncbi:MAG: NADH-quinone oxidoreductase subunit J [Bacteroidota bacterium]
MSASTVIFYILSAAILGGALLAVTSRKIFRAAIYLLFSLLGIAGLYFYLNYEFIAAVQIVVYVGGIVVLIIFSIFLTHEAGADMPRPGRGRMLFSALAAAFALILTLMLINRQEFYPSQGAPVEASVKNIGTQMLSLTEHGYILPFEAVSILLLAAMIGCIVIAIKTRTKA